MLAVKNSMNRNEVRWPAAEMIAGQSGEAKAD
jgi:hypothetical protein